MTPREMTWTDEQAAAVTSTGDVLLAASAGTGKTTTVVGKILWMLGLDVGVDGEGNRLPPCAQPCRMDQIAAITFTEKGAYDLKRKLREQIQESEGAERLTWEIDRASVGTIHAFCGEMLREHSLRLGIDPTFRVLDERETRIEQDELIRDILMRALEAGDPEAALLVKRFNLYDRTHQKGGIGQVRAVLRDIRWHAARYEGWVRRGPDAKEVPELDLARLQSIAEAAGIESPAGDKTASDLTGLQVAGALYRIAYRSLGRWLGWLEQENVRDFDSLILDARRLLTRESTRPALQAIRGRYRLLIIDEFQDTDAAQRDIAFAITGRLDDPPPPPGERPQLFLVGDPQQSIYGFRGADVSVWNEVRTAVCEDGRALRLTHNFRSDPKVVALVNRVCSRVMAERVSELSKESPDMAVEYSELRSARGPSAVGAVEWLANDGKGAGELAAAEGRLIASRIRDLVGRELVLDPDDGRMRPCEFRDIAILARTREALAGVEPGLRQYGIPHYNSATSGLAGRQEILDVVTSLRLADNPRDDLRGFAWLRSPFVGLRDELLARIRLDPEAPSASFLDQAEAFLLRATAGSVEPFEAPESREILHVELEALRNGLEAIRDAHRLVDRAEHAELVELLLERTGYRLHLLLRDGAAEALANLERFQSLLSDYRHLALGAFLRLWDRWEEQDLGLPQAALFSHEDDVVTLSTIHTAKGLEWPVVILAKTRDGPGEGGRLSNSFWSDPDLGPVFLPVKAERGARSDRAFRRAVMMENAEEARLLYVAATRARDRLIVSGPTADPSGFSAWLAPALDDAIEAHEAESLIGSRRPAGRGEAGRAGRGDNGRARSPDAATRTGSQIDAFGFDHDPEDSYGQFSLFGGETTSTSAEDAQEGARPAIDIPTVVHRTPRPIQQSLSEVPVSLGWLDGYVKGDPPSIVQPIAAQAYRFATSATELRLRERSPDEWRLLYRHGVIPKQQFAGGRDRGGLPATVRGALIHGVLERIEEEAELARILNEAIAGLDAPESESLLEPGTEYRRALESEIAAVVRSPQWAWYVDDPHWRELDFLHLVGPRDWRVGAFDLFRPARPGAEGRDGQPWIVDFKTHEIEAEQATATAAEYDVQVAVYRSAVSDILGLPSGPGAGGDSRIGVALHFTRPNLPVEV